MNNQQTIMGDQQVFTLERSLTFFRRLLSRLLLYFVLLTVAAVTVFPFVWILFTSFKGPNDPIVSVPPQLIPRDPTFSNYTRVWEQLPIGRFYLNSIMVSFGIVIFNTFFSALAAYPRAR
jgi:putative chitobiose transport system permease protein